MKKQETTKRGFTVIEIMIIVLVIGVLLAVVLPSIRAVRRNSRIKQAEAQLEILAAAIKQLAWDTGKFPGAKPLVDGKEVPNLTVPDAGLLAEDGDFPNWKGPYIRNIPLDPWGARYFFDADYTMPDGDVRTVVGSHGPNRSAMNAYDSDNIVVLLDD